MLNPVHSLSVREADGDPSVADVTTIVLPSGTLTDDGAGRVTYTPAAPDLSGYAQLAGGNTFTGTQVVSTILAGASVLVVGAQAGSGSNEISFRDDQGNAVLRFGRNTGFTVGASITWGSHDAYSVGSVTGRARYVYASRGFNWGNEGTQVAALDLWIRSPGEIAQAVRKRSGQTEDSVRYLDSDGTTVLARLGPNFEWCPPALADSASLSGSVYYSTTASKLVYKDAGGSVHTLY